jgi:Mg2+/Co2+ transporter CorB
MEGIPLAWQFGLLAVLLVVSGFFAMAETAMMALNRYRLRALVRLGNRGARIAQELLAKTDRLLAVILAGNTLVNAAITMLASVITIQLFGEDKIALGIATVSVAFLILVFAEITPKVVGARFPEKIALPASFILKPLLQVSSAALWIVNLFVASLLALFRIKSQDANQPQRLTMEELRMVVLESAPFMPKKHQSILVNLFDLERITVEDVMTPRSRIEAIDIDAPLDRINEQLATAYHTRLPVYRAEPGTVIGILHLRKVLHLVQRNALDREGIESLLAEPYFVPASTPVFAQLHYFQENHQRIALAVDEYGELQGLVTLEDIIEEIIGDFTTTAPESPSAFRWEADGTALVEGTAALRDLNRKLGLTLPLDGPKTLNGLILEHLQDIPESGVSVRISGVPMEILQTQDRVIKTVRLFKPATPDPSDTD